MNITRHAPAARRTRLVTLSLLLVLTLLASTLPRPGLMPTASAFDGVIVPGFTQLSIGPGDDHSSEEIHLPFAISFFGTTYRSLYVNNNGNVTFDAPLSAYTPFSLLSTSHPMIAPFFGDVDTRGIEAERAINSDFARYGVSTFEGHRAFGVTWGGVGVGYYDSRVDKLNKFQMLIVERPDEGPGDFDIVFNYDQIQWETGEASGGLDGLGGDSARAGFTNGSDASFEMPGSAINGAFLDGAPTGLRHNSNVNVAGRYVFPVRNGLSAVYTSTGFLVNGLPLPLCPRDDA
ncbi:MAG TPA: nidogen-like domain-containing protein, partial [Pyrinomonadaceae bacterium]|nr:nidogen-like domain-containing protein [Pyrinomonadaceae bacterium]